MSSTLTKFGDDHQKKTANCRYCLDYFFILLIIAVGAAGLLFRIGVMPPLFPWSDESEIAADAVASLETGLQLTYPLQLAGGSLAVWLETGWMALFGKSLLGLRWLNGLVNLASALILYLLVRQLPLNTSHTAHSIDRRCTAGIAAMLFVSSTWFLGLGRIATPNWSLTPLLASLAFYLFWSGLNSGRRGYFVASGIVTGLLFYGYLPGYLVGVIPAVFLALWWLLKIERPKSINPASILLMFFAAFLVAAPIIASFVQNPVLVMNRPLQLVHTGDLSASGSLLQSGLDMLSTFGLYPNWLLGGNFINLAFNPVNTVLFVIGFLVALRRWRKPAYLFILLWWGVMMLPALLSRSASVGFIFEVWRRGVGAQPVSFIFPALAVVSLMQWLQTQWLSHQSQANQKNVLAVIFAVIVVISTSFSYWFYFYQWANSGVIPLIFAESPVQLADWLETTGEADTLYLFPIRPNVSPTTRPELFTVRYLYNGSARLTFPVMDEATIDQTLADLLDNRLRQVKLMLPDHVMVDPKEYFNYALSSIGQITAQERKFGYTATTYRLNNTSFPAASLATLDAAFGQSLRLTGWRIQPEHPVAGQSPGVALRWARVGSDQAADFNARVSLHDTWGYEIARDDHPLLSGKSYLTSQHWAAGEESTLYYSLPIPADTSPGRYTLRLIAYNPATDERLPPAGGQPDLSFALTDINVQPASADAEPAQPAAAHPVLRQFPGGLQLVGAEGFVADFYRPGDRLQVTLRWQAAKPLAQNIGLQLMLTAPHEPPFSLFETTRPLIENYPTPVWPAGRSYRVNYAAWLPEALASGHYQLTLRLVDLDTGQQAAEQSLGELTIEARPHYFDAPNPAYPLHVDFGPGDGRHFIRLLGFEPAENWQHLQPGQSIKIKLQWQALQAIPASYKQFLHLRDGTGQIVSQADALPQQGAALTTGWLPGEIIEDTLTLTLPPDGAAGGYQLVVGLYNAETGERLVNDQSDQVVLFEW